MPNENIQRVNRNKGGLGPKIVVPYICQQKLDRGGVINLIKVKKMNKRLALASCRNEHIYLHCNTIAVYFRRGGYFRLVLTSRLQTVPRFSKCAQISPIPAFVEVNINIEWVCPPWHMFLVFTAHTKPVCCRLRMPQCKFSRIGISVNTRVCTKSQKRQRNSDGSKGPPPLLVNTFDTLCKDREILRAALSEAHVLAAFVKPGCTVVFLWSRSHFPTYRVSVCQEATRISPARFRNGYCTSRHLCMSVELALRLMIAQIRHYSPWLGSGGL